MSAAQNSVSPPSAGWHGRAAFALTNGVVEAVLLPGGGHLAGWRFSVGHGPSQDNVIWESPWRTADPGTPAHAAIALEDGDHATGQFLASYTGHALCLDGFGPPDKVEAAAGVSLHGEASNATWKFVMQHANSATCSVDLPVAGLHVDRNFALLPQESVLRVEERVTNLRASERDLHWVQHATFGAPFFASGVARATASVGKGMTWPLDYEGHNLLARDEAFTWPYAPGAGDDRLDLRELFTRQGTGFVAAAEQRPEREHGFVAVCHTEIGLVAGYVYRAEDFPWVTIWEENRARQDAPWRGETQARGMEFGTTPFPLGNEAVDKQGPLLGRPTSRRIGAHQTLRARWLLFIAAVPRGWREIADVCVETDEIALINMKQQVRVNARGVTKFLDNIEEIRQEESV
jgi:hypothetical protein